MFDYFVFSNSLYILGRSIEYDVNWVRYNRVDIFFADLSSNEDLSIIRRSYDNVDICLHLRNREQTTFGVMHQCK